MYRAYRPERGALGLDAVLFDDFDASRRHRAGDLLDRDSEGRCEFLGDGLAVPLAWSEDDIPNGSGRDGGDGRAHDLAVPFDLHLANLNPDGQVGGVVPLAAGVESPQRQDPA